MGSEPPNDVVETRRRPGATWGPDWLAETLSFYRNFNADEYTVGLVTD